MASRKPRRGQTTPENYPRRAVWPYPDVVRMSAHEPSGQWRKRHQGRDYYFGVIADPAAALARWREEWPRILDGLPRRPIVPADTDIDSMTVRDAVKAWVSAKIAAQERGELAHRTMLGYHHIAKFTIGALSAERPVADLGPADFARVMRAMSHLSPIRRQNVVTIVRSIFRWLEGNRGVRVNMGTDFRGPPMRLRRRQRNERRGRLLTPAQIHALLAACTDERLTAAMLLGINGGFDNAAVSMLRPGEIDLRGRWVHCFRSKTESERRVPLWPETVRALKPFASAADREWCFVSDTGRQLDLKGSNDIGRMFRALVKSSKIVRGKQQAPTFRWFRYTFATIAAEIRDDHARKIIMGHVIDDVPENYVLQFPDAALRALTGHVHGWLYGGEKKKRGVKGRGGAGGSGRTRVSGGDGGGAGDGRA